MGASGIEKIGVIGIGLMGSGIAQVSAAYGFDTVVADMSDEVVKRGMARIEDCQCLSPQGCVECCCDERCKEMNVVMSKAGAGVILRCLLGWEVDVDALPWGEELDGEEFDSGELAGGLETIIKAAEVPWKSGCNPGDRGPSKGVDKDN